MCGIVWHNWHSQADSLKLRISRRFCPIIRSSRSKSSSTIIIEPWHTCAAFQPIPISCPCGCWTRSFVQIFSDFQIFMFCVGLFVCSSSVRPSWTKEPDPEPELSAYEELESGLLNISAGPRKILPTSWSNISSISVPTRASFLNFAFCQLLYVKSRSSNPPAQVTARPADLRASK